MSDLSSALEKGRQMIREALAQARTELDEVRARGSELERQIAEAEAALGETAAAAPVAFTSPLTLHAALVQVLRESGNQGLTARELADAVNNRGLYRRRDGSAVEANQVQARINNYSTLFTKDEAGVVRLRSDAAELEDPPDGVVVFRDDDDGFFGWLAEHPEGFVINTERKPNPNYLVLHRPDCPRFKNGEGRCWTKGYAKVCSAHRQSLEDWIEASVGGDVTLCRSCFG